MVAGMSTEGQYSRLTTDGTVNHKGEPAEKSKHGGCKVTPVILAAEAAERAANFGLQLNLISYLFYVKHLHLPDAANMTTNYVGASSLFCILGGFLADTVLGRFWTIFSSGILQAVGYSVLLINATLDEFKCSEKTCSPAHGTDLAVIYIGLYLVALGTGGLKANVSAFGADQIDKMDQREALHLPHYFNWFYFAITTGCLVGATALVYLQDQSWPWGFGSLVIIMTLAMSLLLTFRSWYRYKVPQGSPFTAVAKVFVAAFRNRKLSLPVDRKGYFDEVRSNAKLRVVQTDNMKWLDKAAILTDFEGNSNSEPGQWRLATVSEVEDTKMVLRLLPILATTWVFWLVQEQFLTVTVAQARTSNRNLGPNFEVRPATVGVIQGVSVLICLALYDRVFMPAARRITGNPNGITSLQRIGLGQFTPILAMMCAALVERLRLRIVHDKNLEQMPSTVIKSFSMFWLTPQYFLMGLGDVLLYVGQLDFFYNESPESMQSLGTSLCLSTVAIGSFASSGVVSTVNRVTSASNPSSAWIQDNLNVSRLDLYYWLLAILSALNLAAYMIMSRFHQYKRTYRESSPSNSQEQELDLLASPVVIMITSS